MILVKDGHRWPMRFALLLLGDLLFFACVPKEAYKAPVFKDMGTVVGDTVVRDVMCTRVIHVYSADSLLLLQCVNSIDKKAFYLYSKNTGKLLKTFGTYGNGPGELPNMFEHTLDIERKTLYVMGGKKFLSFQLDSILRNEDYPITQLELNITANQTAFFYMKDSLFCSMNDFRPEKNYRLAMLTSNQERVAFYNKIPAINTQEHDSIAIRAFYALKTMGTIKPDGKKFVIVTTCGLNMELFDLEWDKIVPTKFIRFVEPLFIPEQGMRNAGVVPGLFWTLSASDAYIYGLWSEDTEQSYPQKIVTFDWDGTPVAQYTFGPGMAGGWAMDGDRAAYITIKDSLGRLNIVRYRLP